MEDNQLNTENNSKLAIIMRFKKQIIIVLVVILLIILGVILRTVYLKSIPEFEVINSTTSEAEKDAGKPIDEYFTYGENALLDYRQTDGSARNMLVFTSFADIDSVQFSVLKPSLGDNWYNEVYEMSDGEIRRVMHLQHETLNVNLLDMDFEHEEIIILKEPIVVGNTWKIGDGDAEATITSVDSEVKTPEGLFKTVEVSTDYKNGNYRKDYFSESKGIVKSVEINNDGSKSELLLTNVEPMSTGLDRAMYVYYLEKDTYKGVPTLVNFKTPTNKEMTEVFRELLSTSTDESLKALISPYTKINSIKFDKNMKYVHVDFSKEFYGYTSKNKATETKHLSALANTFCRYYNVLNFKITVDGQPYSTANYQFGEDDTIKATFK